MIRRLLAVVVLLIAGSSASGSSASGPAASGPAASGPAASGSARARPARAPATSRAASPEAVAWAAAPVATTGDTTPPGSAAGYYRAPLAGRLVVLRRFEPPPTPYAAGHRGVDLAAPHPPTVLAAGAGMVSFAGQVAGRGVVVITHPDGIRTEYEPVSPSVTVGQVVAAGQPIGQVHGTHGAWPVDGALHWGARRGEAYIDPLLLLRPLGPVRLLPWPR